MAFGLRYPLQYVRVEYNPECFQHDIMAFAEQHCPETPVTKDNQANILAKMACYAEGNVRYRLSSEFFGRGQTGKCIQKDLMRYIDPEEKFRVYLEAIRDNFDGLARGDNHRQLLKENKRLTAENEKMKQDLLALQEMSAAKDATLAKEKANAKKFKDRMCQQFDKNNALWSENAKLKALVREVSIQNQMLKKRRRNVDMDVSTHTPVKPRLE